MLALVGSPHLCSRAFITEQYDRYVRGNTAVLAEHADGGVLRIDETTGRGVAVSTDASALAPSSTYTAAHSSLLAEAFYRATSPSPAPPDAATNCLNFGSPGGSLASCGSSPRRCADWRMVVRRTWNPGHRRQRQLLQPDWVDRHPADPGRRCARVIDDVAPAGCPTGLGAEPGETLLLLGDTQ